MDTLNLNDKQAKRIESYPYEGTPLPVKNVTIKWLSQAGGDKESPDYGLRFFTVGPGGEIPIHNHFYIQTMYILSGNLLVYSHNPENDEILEEKLMGANDIVFVPSMESHSMKNPSNKKEATFLCCIANVYEDNDSA